MKIHLNFNQNPALILGTITENQIRWHSELGKIIQESVREYLLKKSEESFVPGNFFSKQKITVDFTDWKYKFKGKVYDSKDYGKKIPVLNDNDEPKQLYDFAGIDLSGIDLNNCIIEDCYFVSAFFDNSNFNNIEFKGCMLDSASFFSSNLTTISFVQDTTIRGIYVDDAWIENIKNLNNDTLAVPFKYTEISYSWIVQQLFRSVFFKDGISNLDLKKANHTTFVNNNTEGLTHPDLKIVGDYINWCQSLFNKLYFFKQLETRRKIGFVSSVIATKYWSSFTALGLSALAINCIYTIIYFNYASSFNTLLQGSWLETLIKSFYFSTVTFMTLGYGDVFPCDYFGQIIVITEVTLGYIVLGLFVYLISRKVDKLY